MPLTTETNKTALFLSNLFARLNEEKITYCVLRNYENLPEKVGNDVDIWVKDEHREKFYEIVKDSAYTLNYTLNYTPRLALIGEGDYFLIKESDNSTYIIHIDCWTYIHWKGLPYINLTSIEKHLKWYKKGFYVSPPGVMVAIMLLKELLQQGKVKDKYKKEIKEYSLREKEIFISSLNNHFGTNYSKFIMEMSQVGNWAALEQKVNTLRIALLIGGLLHPLSQFKNWFNYFHAQFRRFFLNSRGIFVVLIGPDGSGKSTTVNNLIELEIKRLFQKKYYFHGHFPFLPELKKIAGFFKRNKKEVINGTQSLRGKTEAISKTWIAMPSDGNDGGGTLSGETHRENQQPFSFLRSMIYPFYYGLNYFLGHFFVWKEKARGNLIIFDRYFYDYFIQGQYDNCPRWLLYTIAKAIPKPDIVIYLKNDPEVIFNRKSELTVEEIKRQQDICEELVKRFSNSFSVVTSTPREVVEQIQRIIINRIREKQK